LTTKILNSEYVSTSSEDVMIINTYYDIDYNTTRTMITNNIYNLYTISVHITTGVMYYNETFSKLEYTSCTNTPIFRNVDVLFSSMKKSTPMKIESSLI